MTIHMNQAELDQHADTWANRPYVGEHRKPALSPESDILHNWFVIRAEAVRWDVPGITVILAECVGIDANDYGYANKVWFVYESDENGRAGQEGPITFNRKHYIIRTSRAELDNAEQMEQATADWTSRAFGM